MPMPMSSVGATLMVMIMCVSAPVVVSMVMAVRVPMVVTMVVMVAKRQHANKVYS
jgi:hypothetical protein